MGISMDSIITRENQMSTRRNMRRNHNQQSRWKIMRRSIRPKRNITLKNMASITNMEMGSMDMIIMLLIIPR